MTTTTTMLGDRAVCRHTCYCPFRAAFWSLLLLLVLLVPLLVPMPMRRAATTTRGWRPMAQTARRTRSAWAAAAATTCSATKKETGSLRNDGTGVALGGKWRRKSRYFFFFQGQQQKNNELCLAAPETCVRPSCAPYTWKKRIKKEIKNTSRKGLRRAPRR